MDNLEIIGYLATLFGATQLIPEILKALKTHHLRDVSWAMLLLMIISSVLWIIYGVAKQTTPLAISSSLNLIFEIVLTVLKFHYHKNSRPLLYPAAVKQPAKNGR